MNNQILGSPYGDLVREVLAGKIEPEAAAIEAVNLMEQMKGKAPTGFSLSFLDMSDSDARLLERFASAAEAELLRRLASGWKAV
jgi:hypothetical protein